MKKFPAIAFLTALLLTACAAPPPPETAPPEQEPSAVSAPEISVRRNFLDLTGVSIPEGFSLEAHAGGYRIFRGDALAGGMAAVDLEQFPPNSTGKLLAAAKQVMAQIHPAEFEAEMVQTGQYGVTEIYLGDGAQAYDHYLFQEDTTCYDLWLDGSQVTPEEKTRLLDTLFYESRSGVSVAGEPRPVSLDGVGLTGASIPEGFTVRLDAGDCALLRGSTPIGGITAVDLPEDVLSDPLQPENQEKIRAALEAQTPGTEDMTVSESRYALAEAYVDGEDGVYIHYIFTTAEGSFDLWLNRLQLLRADELLLVEGLLPPPPTP